MHFEYQQESTSIEIDLKSKKISEEDSIILGNDLKKLTHLLNLSINLDNNKVGVKGIEGLASGLENLNQLTYLRLSLRRNKLGDEEAKIVGKCLRSLLNLTHLKINLYSNNIEMEGLTVTGNSLGFLNKLTHLTIDLTDNKIQEEGVLNLVKPIENLINLIQLSLCFKLNNKLTTRCIEQVSLTLQKLVKIQDLCLSFNNCYLFDETSKHIIEGLQNLKNLFKLNLDLSGNYYTEEGMLGILNCLGNLKKLKILEIAQTRISYNKVFPIQFQQSFRNLENIVYFTYKRHKVVCLSGDILLSIKKMKRLVKFQQIKLQGDKDF